MGNCGRDPEVRYLPSGQAVANVSIATSTRRKNRETGDMVEDTQWHRITFYDRLAEIAGEYVKKGRPIYVEGRLKYGKYTDQAGVEKIPLTSLPQSCNFLAVERVLAALARAMTQAVVDTHHKTLRTNQAPKPQPQRLVKRQRPALMTWMTTFLSKYPLFKRVCSSDSFSFKPKDFYPS